MSLERLSPIDDRELEAMTEIFFNKRHKRKRNENDVVSTSENQTASKRHKSSHEVKNPIHDPQTTNDLIIQKIQSHCRIFIHEYSIILRCIERIFMSFTPEKKTICGIELLDRNPGEESQTYNKYISKVADAMKALLFLDEIPTNNEAGFIYRHFALTLTGYERKSEYVGTKEINTTSQYSDSFLAFFEAKKIKPASLMPVAKPAPFTINWGSYVSVSLKAPSESTISSAVVNLQMSGVKLRK